MDERDKYNFETEENREEFTEERVENLDQSTNSSHSNTNKTEDLSNGSVAVFAEIIAKAKAWFSERPISAFSGKLSKGATFTILGINIFVMVVTFILSVNSTISSFLPFNIDSSSALLFPSLVILIAFYLMLALTIKVIAVTVKSPKSSYMSALELIAINTIPSFVLGTIGFLLGFIFAPLSMMVMFVSLITNLIGLYLGFQKYLGMPEKSPFWPFAIGLLIFAIIFSIFFTILSITLIGSSIANNVNRLRHSDFPSEFPSGFGW
ncbi:hypothetical protein [Helcococcus kunzii]|uniref:hypothetical protein n=1 Tax=Helcococcus kunzii TaxID=40091 RepID=UPI0038ABDD7F